MKGLKWPEISLKGLKKADFIAKLRDLYSQMVKSESSNRSRISSKGALAVALSSLDGFSDPKVMIEQYSTDSEIAAQVLWHAHMREKTAKVSADLGCGSGILGIGLLLLGAEKVYFVDSDPQALEIAKKNLEAIQNKFELVGGAIFHQTDVGTFSSKIDLIVQNPPFGVKVRGADRKFLEQALKLAKVTYSFHKSESKRFVMAFAEEKGCKVTDMWDFNWPLKATYAFHAKKRTYISVSCFRIEKVNG